MLTVAGDLSAGAAARAAQLGTLLPIEDVRFPNSMRDGRWVSAMPKSPHVALRGLLHCPP